MAIIKSYQLKGIPDSVEVGAFRAFSGDIADLNNLPQAQRKPGMFASTGDGSQLYKLKSHPWTYTDSDWEEVMLTKKVDEVKFIDRETIAGDVDGINDSFILQYTPIVGSEHVYLNGILQESGIEYDYVSSRMFIIFNEAPPTDSRIKCSYRYL
jgi:hypothetical protein